MATLLLGLAGSAIGGALLPSGLTILGTTLWGATIGGAIGSALGSVVDQALLGPSTAKAEGPRLSELQLQASTEGAPIQSVYGRARIAGQVIWAANFKEVAETREVGGGGKGLGRGGRSKSEVTEYSYYASFAIGLCEGPVTRIGRIWADGRPLTQDGLTIRLHPGTEDQAADPLIAAIEGASGAVPAFRGLAYVVFEDLLLEPFGNRVPQLAFEVFRLVPSTSGLRLEERIRAIDLIPGSGEFALATTPAYKVLGPGITLPENINNNMGVPDATVSLDEAEALMPNLGSALVVVTWFGDDLRAGSCTIRPKVEVSVKTTEGLVWSVNGLTRATAAPVSVDAEGFPVFGGTPSDASLVALIQDLKARGLKVVFYPFVMLDVPAGNGKPNPYSPVGEQPAFPWRGRITCHPAPGVAGSPDKTAAAATQVQAFFGSAGRTQFSVVGQTVTFTGSPSDWGYRRFALHYAHLVEAAGGVDAFVIASELEGLTAVRSAAQAYPAVSALKTLAADVRAVLRAGTKIGYAANWSEYHSHRPADGSGDLTFHLDPLWSDAAIDFVGIDYYMPLADWRDGVAHADYSAGFRSSHDLTYLRANIEGGEGYAWSYASPSNRELQLRTPIADTAHGKPWVFRVKDIRQWWANAHVNRVSGAESGPPTGWVAHGKPIWLTELGCPAVDKGANAPNVFVDPKSSESALPFFSNGGRDDMMQRRYLEAVLGYFDPAAGNNPVSSVYGGRMIDPDMIHVWAWDARPYPEFPARDDVWRDAPNWSRGHWLNGRMGQVPLADLVPALARRAGFTALKTDGLTPLVTGYAVERIMSPRDAIEPLLVAYRVDAAESEGQIRFRERGGAPVVALSQDGLALVGEEGEGALRLVRGQETELPVSAKVSFIDAESDYRRASVDSRRVAVSSARVSEAEFPIVMTVGEGRAIADLLLMERWLHRETASFGLPPSQLALDPGDVLTLDLGSRQTVLRLTGFTDTEGRLVRAVASETGFGAHTFTESRPGSPARAVIPGRPAVEFLDLPLIDGTEVPHRPRIAAFADPWPGAVAVYRSGTDSGFRRDVLVTTPARMGATTTALFAGPVGRFDRGNQVWVALDGGTLESRSERDVLDGANLLAIRNAQGEWELLQFVLAELVAAKTYKLSQLLRGQAGTERAMRNPVAAGARVVVIDGALIALNLAADERNRLYNLRYGPASKPLDDFTYQTVVQSFAGLGLRPLSPVRVRAQRNTATNDITLTWIRRTRLNGDLWDQLDVPLAEDREAYEIDIMNGALVRRTLSATTTSVVYTAAQQVADFGVAPVTPLTVRVHQISATFGRGSPREVTLNV